MRTLFVTPHRLSSGEAITALHAANRLAGAGHATHFIASERSARFISRHRRHGITALMSDRAANQRKFLKCLLEFRPDVLVFADFAVLDPRCGGEPLLDQDWLARLDQVDAVLATFDHLGIEQKNANAGESRSSLYSPQRPERMEVLLPCPMHDPDRLPGRVGIPFRYWQPPQLSPQQVESVRARYGVGSRDRLIFHSVSPWARQSAAERHNPLYQFLPRILSEYLGELGEGVTLVSVNDGELLPDLASGELSIVNISSLPPNEYEALIVSADLILTENCYSVTLGKAVCAGIPVVAWHNPYDLRSLLGQLEGPSTASVAEFILRSPGAITPWIAFPMWPPELRDHMRVFENNRISRCFEHLSLFAGEASARVLQSALVGSEYRSRIRAEQHAYNERVEALPDACQVLLASV